MNCQVSQWLEDGDTHAKRVGLLPQEPGPGTDLVGLLRDTQSPEGPWTLLESGADPSTEILQIPTRREGSSFLPLADVNPCFWAPKTRKFLSGRWDLTTYPEWEVLCQGCRTLSDSQWWLAQLKLPPLSASWSPSLTLDLHSFPTKSGSQTLHAGSSFLRGS